MESTKDKFNKSKIGYIPKDWQAIPIGKILKFKNGLNKEKEYFGKGTPIVNYMDVLCNPGLQTKDINGKVTLTKEEIRNYEVRKGDVFFTRTSETVDEIGMSSVMLEDIKDSVFSGFVLRGRPKNNMLDLYYKQYCFRANEVRRQICSTSSYTTRALTNGRLLSNVYIPLPPTKTEQNAIATALNDIDKLIISLKKLISKKREIKQGMMQDLLTSKRRLSGFSVEWEMRKLGEIAEIRKGELITEKTSKYGSVPVIAGGIVPSYFHNQPNRKANTITVSASGANAGFVAFHPYSIFASDCSTIEDDKAYDVKFLYYSLLLRQKAITHLQTGGAQPHVYPEQLKTFEITVPESIAEQSTVAMILTDMDSEIKIMESKLSKYGHLKQGMMQVLLAGKIRLI